MSEEEIRKIVRDEIRAELLRIEKERLQHEREIQRIKDMIELANPPITVFFY